MTLAITGPYITTDFAMVTRKTFLRSLLTAAAIAAAVPATFALDAPAGKVVLSVAAGSAPRSDFDMAMLEKLPQHTFTTKTPWYPQPRTFTGPLLRDVLGAAAAAGTTLRLVALNDYKIEMPLADAQQYDVIVARLMDGEAMPVRDKGPLFVVYPFDSNRDLHSERYYSRSAWQLRKIEVR